MCWTRCVSLRRSSTTSRRSRGCDYPAAPHRGHRIRVFLDAYGQLPVSTDTVVDDVVARLGGLTQLVRGLADAGHEPQVTWVAKGYLARLAEQATWVDRHRELFAGR